MSAGGDEMQMTKNAVERMADWMARTQQGQLPAKLAWISYQYKLWAGMRYGLTATSLRWQEINGIMDRLNYEVLPLLGVNRNVRKRWRCIPREFGGTGLYDLAIEQLICWINAILQHYGSGSLIDQKVKASLEALQLELGCAGNPFHQSFATIGHLATPCWVVLVWERLDIYKFSLHLEYPVMAPPRLHDIFFTEIFLEGGYTGHALAQLNRCRLSLKALFLSDVTSATGRTVVLGSLVSILTSGRHDSKFKFPHEAPTASDWCTWERFWGDYTGIGKILPRPLGRWLNDGHIQWKWKYNETTHTIWEDKQELWVSYSRTVERSTWQSQ